MAGRFDLGNTAAELMALANGAKTADKEVKKLDKDAEQLNRTLSRAAAAVARTQAASTKVAGVYGAGGTNAFSKYKPKGIGGAGKIFGAPPTLGASSPLHSTWNPAMGGVLGSKSQNVQRPNNTGGSGFLAQLGSSNSRLQKLNKSFFKFQMATLGLAFSFGGLEQTVIGAMSAIGDLGGMFKGAAQGKAFTGVDMGVLGDPSKIVEGWKAFQGILGLITATLGVITANMLTPDVMAAIGKFFTDLAPVLPMLGEALGKVLLNAIGFLDSLIPLIPILIKIIDIFAPWLGVLLPIILILGTLLPLLSALGYVFAAVELVAVPLAAIVAGLSATMLAWIAVIIAIGLVVYHFINNLMEGQDIISAFGNAIIQTFTDIANMIMFLLSPVLNLLGLGGGSSTPQTSNVRSNSNTTINIYGDTDQSTPRKIANAQNRAG